MFKDSASRCKYMKMPFKNNNIEIRNGMDNILGMYQIPAILSH